MCTFAITYYTPESIVAMQERNARVVAGWINKETGKSIRSIHPRVWKYPRNKSRKLNTCAPRREKRIAEPNAWRTR